MQHTYYFMWRQNYIQFTKMSLIYIFCVWLHVSASQGHLQATHFDGIYCPVPTFDGIHCPVPTFVSSTQWCTPSLFLILMFWECLFFSCLCILASLCPFECAAPLVMCTLYWFGVPCQYKVHTTRGAAHSKGHRGAEIQRWEKNRHFQNTKIETNDDVNQWVLLTEVGTVQWWKVGESYIMRSFITYTLCQV
jgi:hypothetical protein